MPSASSASRSGRTLRTAAFALAGIALIAYPFALNNSYLRYVGVVTLMYACLSTSWSIMGGFTGYVSLGHSAFFGLGAYVTALSVTDLGVPGFVAAIGAGVAVGILAVAIGYVALRVRGASFVIVTIALVYITNLLAQGWRTLTGGSQGLIVPSPLNMPRTQRHLVFYLIFLFMLAVLLGLWWFINQSKFGMGLKAIRGDEDKAESLGVPTTSFKVVAFALSAGFTAVGGGLYGLWFGRLDPIFAFAIIIGANMVLMALLGGVRYMLGPTLGAFIIAPSTEYFLTAYGGTQLHVVLAGLLLAIVVLAMPDGIIPAVRNLSDRRKPPAASIREEAPPTAGPVASEVPT